MQLVARTVAQVAQGAYRQSASVTTAAVGVAADRMGSLVDETVWSVAEISRITVFRV